MRAKPKERMPPPPSDTEKLDEAFADDLYGVKSIAEDIMAGFKQMRSTGGVFALNGGYGTGKTFILKRIQVFFENRGTKHEDSPGAIRGYYFNAWKNDGQHDPLIPLLASLYDDEEKKSDSRREVARELVLMASKFTHRWLGFDWYGLLPGDDTLSETEKRLKEKFAKLSLDGKEGAVVMIDELDRCRPPFALKLMERVKHFLSVEKVLFIFAFDFDALGKFVQKEYGEIDAVGYLNRFFDHTYTLSPGVLSGKNEESIYDALSDVLENEYEFVVKEKSREVQEKVEVVCRLICCLAKNGSFTPREVVKMLGLVTRSILNMDKRGKNLTPLVIAPLIAAKIKDMKAYREMIDAPNGAKRLADLVVSWSGSQQAGFENERVMLDFEDALDMEAALYCASRNRKNFETEKQHAETALGKVANGREGETTNAEKMMISGATLEGGRERAAWILEKLNNHDLLRTWFGVGVSSVLPGFRTIKKQASLIDAGRN